MEVVNNDRAVVVNMSFRHAIGYMVNFLPDDSFPGTGDPVTAKNVATPLHSISPFGVRVKFQEP